MAELNSTGTTTRAWAPNDEFVVVAEGGGSPDALARVSGGIPVTVLEGGVTLGQVIARHTRGAY